MVNLPTMSSSAWCWLAGAVGLSLGCAAAAHPPLAPSVGPAQRGQAIVLDADPVVTSPAAEPLPGPTARTPGWLGVALTAQAPDHPGVIISSVLRRSPAALGGLEVGDVVVGIDDVRVNDPGVFSRLVAQRLRAPRAKPEVTHED